MKFNFVSAVNYLKEKLLTEKLKTIEYEFVSVKEVGLGKTVIVYVTDEVLDKVGDKAVDQFVERMTLKFGAFDEYESNSREGVNFHFGVCSYPPADAPGKIRIMEIY